MPKMAFAEFSKKPSISIGFIGTGLRGQWLIDLAAKRDDVHIPAICDIDEAMIKDTIKILQNNKKDLPEVYNKGEYDYQNLIKRIDLDAIIIATPWEWHAQMSIAAMKAGKHVGTEVPAALTVDDCWSLVKTSEKTGKFCMIMENVCYRRDVMAVLNMVRDGMFGEYYTCKEGTSMILEM